MSSSNELIYTRAIFANDTVIQSNPHLRQARALEGMPTSKPKMRRHSGIRRARNTCPGPSANVPRIDPSTVSELPQRGQLTGFTNCGSLMTAQKTGIHPVGHTAPDRDPRLEGEKTAN